MDRRVLALLALLAVVPLAGCSYDTTIAVTPEVEGVDSDGDGHRLQVAVDPDLDNVDATVANVRVHGYDLDGELVCSAPFGDLDARATRTLTCERFPSLLVADTSDRGRQVEVDDTSPFNDPPDLTVVSRAALYRGHGNGSHHFELIVPRTDRNPDFTVADGRVVPTDARYQTMQCRQWRDRRDGRDFDALADAPWLAWERHPPETGHLYTVEISNYSRYADRGETERFDPAPAGNTYERSALPDTLVSVLRTADRHRGDPVALEEREFVAVVDGLAESEANATANTSAAMRAIRGRHHVYDNSEIDCHATPPQHGGERGTSVRTYVAFEGYTYHVVLRTRETVDGNAFENVTAP